MKKNITILTLIITGSIFSQITIGKNIPHHDPANSSVSLELGNATGGKRGLVLPWVTSESVVDKNGCVAGTLIFDAAPDVQKVKFKNDKVWIDLSSGAFTPEKKYSADNYKELPNGRAMIGGKLLEDKTPGVLILAAPNHAMILPRVRSVANIVNPSAGMMVYVTGSVDSLSPNAKQLAVYNGKEWTFWTKP